MKQLMCTGRDGQTRTFYYDLIESGEREAYAIHTDSVQGDEWFEFAVQKEADRLRVVMMSHNDDKRFIAMGIPEAMIEELAKTTGLPVVSSRNGADPGEWQTVGARKVWLRLGSRVSFDADEGRFVYA